MDGGSGEARARRAAPRARPAHCSAAAYPIIGRWRRPSTTPPPREPRRRAALLGGRTVRRVPRDASGTRRRCSSATRSPASPASFDAAALAARSPQRDDVESRLVVRDGARWTLAHGPFRRADCKALPARDWTLLVQGVNLHSDAADALLRRFAFVPYARLDDLMVSYAAPGGGVGPHVDSYDVFLLQGVGRRRWRYGRQDDLALRPGLPLKILQRFAPEHDAVLGPGDMLYLPPQYAHDGIGARAVHDVLDRLSRARARTSSRRRFSISCATRSTCRAATPIPISRPPRAPARIAAAMRRQCARMLTRHPLGRRDDRALPRLLALRAEAARVLRAAAPPLPRAAFAAPRGAARPALDRRTQLLYDDGHLFVNGAALPWPAAGAPRAGPPRRPRGALAPRDAAALGRRARRTALRLVSPWLPPRRPRLTPAPPRHPAARCSTPIAAQVAAIDELIGLAQHSIRVFDVDLSEMGWNRPRRSERLAAFLRGSRHARLEIIVHDTRYLEAPVRAAAQTLQRLFSEADHHLSATGAAGARRDGSAGDRRRPPLPASLPLRPAARRARHRGASRHAAAQAALRRDLGDARGELPGTASACSPGCANAQPGAACPLPAAPACAFGHRATAARRSAAPLRGSARSRCRGRGGSGPCPSSRRSSRPTAGSRPA